MPGQVGVFHKTGARGLLWVFMGLWLAGNFRLADSFGEKPVTGVS